MAASSVQMFFKRAVSFPNDMLFVITGNGAWRIQFPVDQIVSHVLTGLPSREADLVRQQLAQPHMHRWWLKGRLNGIYFYSLASDTMLVDPLYQDCFFRVEMRVDGKRQHADVAFFRGRISGVDLPKPTNFYRGKTITFGAVKLGKSSQSLARAWDRQEHGREEET